MRSVICLLMSLMLAGCAANSSVIYTTDLGTGKTVKKVISPVYRGFLKLQDGRLGCIISVVNEKKVNPITHGLAQAVGALGPDDMYPPGTLSVRFKNFSQQAMNTEMTAVTISGERHLLNHQNVLPAGEETISPVINVKISEWEAMSDPGKFQIKTELEYTVDGQAFKQEFLLVNLTKQEIKDLYQ